MKTLIRRAAPTALAVLTSAIPSIAMAHPGHEHAGSPWTHHALESGVMVLAVLVIGGLLFAALRRTHNRPSA